MTDQYDPFDNHAVDRTVSTMDESPDDAARAIELGQKTGANPVAIHADIEEWENNAKAATTAKLIRGNRYISDYINSHPLAGIVSNGDLNKLDEASTKMKALPKGRSPVEKDFGETAGSIAMQWGEDLVDAVWESGKSLASIPKDIDKHTIPSDEIRIAADAMRKDGPDFHNISAFLGQLNNLFVTQIASGDPLNPASQYKPVNLGAQDLVGGLVGAFGAVTGLTPTVKSFAKVGQEVTGVPGEFTEQIAMLGMMFMGLRGGKSHVKGGEVPPPGLSKETDGIREHRSKENLNALDEATKSIQSSATAGRSPSLAREFAGQHVEDRSVYVNVDAIRRLYGDKPPTHDDGILGWVEGLGDQISANAEVGGDVAIPLKDWLTKIDPEVAKILHDDTKVLRDDTTVNEALALKGEEPKVREGGDPNKALADEVSAFDKQIAEKNRLANEANDKGDNALRDRLFDEADQLKEQQKEVQGRLKQADQAYDPYPKPNVPPGAGGPDMSRRGFLKGVGAAGVTAATGKAGKIAEAAANPFAGADLSMFQKNVEFAAAEQYAFAEKLYGPEAQKEAVKTLSAIAKRLDAEGANRMHEEAAKLLQSGWVPPKELLDQVSKINTKGEGRPPSEMTRKMVEEDSVRPMDAEEIGSLPWPEEYMKGDYPKGLIEPGPREAMRLHQEAIDESRQGARLNPIVPQDLHEVRLQVTDVNEVNKFTDQAGQEHAAGLMHDINVNDANGKYLGWVSAILEDAGKKLYIDNMMSATGEAWSLGMGAKGLFAKAFHELHVMFPEIETIAGWHISGAGEPKYREIPVSHIKDMLGAPDRQRDKTLTKPLELGPSEPFRATTQDSKLFEGKSVGSLSLRSALGHFDFDAALKNSPIAGALNAISRAIMDKAGNTRVHFIKDNEFEAMVKGKNYAAFHDTNFGSMVFPERALKDPFLAQDVLHESVHAATSKLIFENSDFNNKITKIMQDIGFSIKDEYGMKDAHEFLAEAISNPRFQKKLMETAISPELARELGLPEKSFIKTIWDAILAQINKVLTGNASREYISALEAAIRVTGEGVEHRFSIVERLRQATHRQHWLQTMERMEVPLGAEGDKFKSPWGYKDYPVDAEQHVKNLRVRIGQMSRDLTEFNKLYGKDEPNADRQRLRDLRQELKDTQARVEERIPESAQPTAFKGPMKPPAMARQGELPGLTRMEDRQAFTPTAMGINKEWYQRYQDLIAKQQGEDAKRRMEVALKRAEQIQTKEWKDTSDRISKEVEEKVRARPDIAVDEALRKGTLGEGTVRPGGRRLRLNAEELTEEQKGVLDKSEYSLDGVHPDDLAGYYGFPSGDAMLERLGQLREHVKETYANSEAFIKAVVREETAKRMETEFGDLGQKILEEARDHITSETQLDLMHEELVGLAMQAGMEMTLTKAQMKAVAKQAFDKHTMADLDVSKYLRLAGKHGIELEKAMLAEDFKTAFKAKQMQTLGMMMAQEAKKVEKAKKVWDRNTKRFAKREVGGIDQRYTNAIHDIMFRTDSTPRPRRTPSDLAESFRLDGWSDISPLKDFVEDRMEAFRELAVPEWLQDPRFEKAFDSLTSKEFMEAHDAMRSLIKNGRDEQRVFSEGNAADLATVFEGMHEQIKDLPIQEDRIDRPEGRIRKWIATSFWAHVNLESMMNRLDRGSKDGLFKKYIMRPIAEASNAKDAMMKKYQGQVAELGRIKDMDKLVENTLFIDPRGDGKPFIMRKRNVLGILQNVGNASNLEKLSRGYGVEPEHIMQWLKRNTTREDWDRAQKIGKIFDDLFAQGARMQHELTGVQPVKVPLQPFIDPFGTVREGWYNPVKYDRKRPGNSPRLMGRSALEEDGYFRATVPTGFLSERTGYIAPMELNLDIVPVRMRQMIHDITMRPAIIQASKFFYNPEFNRMIRKQYGDKPVEEFVPFLRDVANSPNFVSYAEQVGNQAMEFFRQNLITTLIGLNPGTVMKHGTTALLNSLQQMGYRDFAHEFFSMTRHDSATGQRNWTMALEKSEELQRRMRNFQEIIAGHGSEINIRGGAGGSRFDTAREVMMQMGATPVAVSDLLSSVPTWLVAYKRAMMEGATEGDAVNRGDLAVRQTHGSSVMSNKPSIMRTNAFGALYTSLYGFFSHMFQKQYEMAWKAKDAMGLASQGEYAQATKRIPELASLFLSYVILPAIIEELVTPYTNSEKDSWGKKLAKTLAFGVGSSMIGVRDFVHGFVNVRDPSAGLVGTMFKTISDVGRDLGRGAQAFTDPVRQAKLINHTMTMFGLLTGLTNASEGKMAEYAWRVNKGLEKPKGPWETLTGMRYGTTRGHSKTFDEYMRHVKGH